MADDFCFKHDTTNGNRGTSWSEIVKRRFSDTEMLIVRTYQSLLLCVVFRCGMIEVVVVSICHVSSLSLSRRNHKPTSNMKHQQCSLGAHSKHEY